MCQDLRPCRCRLTPPPPPKHSVSHSHPCQLSHKPPLSHVSFPRLELKEAMMCFFIQSCFQKFPPPTPTPTPYPHTHVPCGSSSQCSRLVLTQCKEQLPDMSQELVLLLLGIGEVGGGGGRWGLVGFWGVGHPLVLTGPFFFLPRAPRMFSLRNQSISHTKGDCISLRRRQVY